VICSYMTRSKSDGQQKACGHPARPRKLGMAVLALCVCHWTRLRKQKRYQKKKLRIGRKPLFREPAGEKTEEIYPEAPAIALKSPNSSETVL